MVDSVVLADSVVRSLVKGLGLGVRRPVDTGEEGVGDGVDKLRARPNMSFAADATVQLPPPPPLPLLLNTPPSIPLVTPELDRISGPPIPAAAPARLVTSDAILLTPQWESQLNKGSSSIVPETVNKSLKFPSKGESSSD